MNKHLNILIILPVLALFLLCSPARAQYVLDWAMPYGGDGQDEANTCIETRDGDLMIGGFAKQKEHQLWIVKTRKDGKPRWGKIFPGYFASSCNSMIQDRDSNIVFTGYAIKKGAFQKDLLVMKIDTLGNVLWHKTYGGILDEEGTKIVECGPEGGYAVCGYSCTNNDGMPNWYMMRIDTHGNKVWDKEFGMSADDRALSIANTSDGGFVITGYLGNANGNAQKIMWIIKLDQDGNDIWVREFEHNMWTCGTAIMETSDSMIVAAGYTRAYTITDYDVLTVKCTADGDTVWTRTFGNEDWQEATDIVETFDGSYVVGGFNMSNSKDQSSFLMLKYDRRGDLIWHNSFKRRSQDYAKSIAETHDHGILLAGTTFSLGKGWDMAVLKMKNVENTELFFAFPTDSLTTSLIDQLTFRMCLKSFGTPREIKVLVNDKIQMVDTEFRKPAGTGQTGGCDYPLEYTVQLFPGKNVIKLEIRDYKLFLHEKELTVYRIPPYDFVR